MPKGVRLREKFEWRAFLKGKLVASLSDIRSKGYFTSRLNFIHYLRQGGIEYDIIDLSKLHNSGGR